MKQTCLSHFGNDLFVFVYYALNLSLLANTKNTIILFVCPPKILHKHCFYILLGLTMIPRETGNNANATFWVDK